jgi:Flp pilus assembly pilin Flp
LNMLGGFFKDEAGASTLEYAFLVTFIALVIFTAITAYGNTVSIMFNYIATTITTTGS